MSLMVIGCWAFHFFYRTVRYLLFLTTYLLLEVRGVNWLRGTVANVSKSNAAGGSTTYPCSIRSNEVTWLDDI